MEGKPCCSEKASDPRRGGNKNLLTERELLHHHLSPSIMAAAPTSVKMATMAI